MQFAKFKRTNQPKKVSGLDLLPILTSRVANLLIYFCAYTQKTLLSIILSVIEYKYCNRLLQLTNMKFKACNFIHLNLTQ